MKEKDITPRILKSLRDDPRFNSGLYEIKVARGYTLPATALKEHQRRALTLANTSAIYFKIPDVGYQNPADSFILKKSEAWVVIYFTPSTGGGECWAIPIAQMPETSVSIDLARKCGLSVKI